MSLGFFRWILCRSPEFRAKRAMGVSTSFFSFSSNEPGDGPRWGKPGRENHTTSSTGLSGPQVERYTVSVCTSAHATHTHTHTSLSLSLSLSLSVAVFHSSRPVRASERLGWVQHEAQRRGRPALRQGRGRHASEGADRAPGMARFRGFGCPRHGSATTKWSIVVIHDVNHQVFDGFMMFYGVHLLFESPEYVICLEGRAV